MNEKKIGLIGLDTSHVVAFSRLLNDPKDPHHVPGAKVVVGFPGGSPDMPLSINRVKGFTEEIQGKYGVRIVDRLEAVAEAADLVFITAVDGRVHHDLFGRVARYGKPTYIDKPLALSVAETKAILEAASSAGIPVMSSSSLRYAESFVAALGDATLGGVQGIDVCGPLEMESTQPGLFWYGIHAVEMIVAAMGVGCRRVRATMQEGCEIFVAEWADGRIATFRGNRKGHQHFTCVLHGEKGFRFVDPYSTGKPPYASLLAAILRSLPHGRSDVPEGQTLEVIRLIEAANTARDGAGCVELDQKP